MKRIGNKKGNGDNVAQELRNLGVLIEDTNYKVGTIAEQYTDIKKTLDEHTKTFNSHTEMIGKVATDVEIVKTDIEFIKGGLRKKVDYDEFITLEKRVAAMESKIRR
jgi:hypothetical protein